MHQGLKDPDMVFHSLITTNQGNNHYKLLLVVT